MSEQTYRYLETREDVEDVMAPEGGASVLYFWGPSGGGGCGCGRPNVECFDEMSKLYADDPVSFVKLDTSRHPELTAPFRIRVLPTYMFVHNGEIVDLFTGGINPKQLGTRIESLASKSRGEGLFSRLLKRRPRRFARLQQAHQVHQVQG